MKILVVILIFAPIFGISEQAEVNERSLSNKYFDYVKRVDAVTSLWKNFLNTPPSNEENRQVALQTFLDEHNRTLALDFEWISSILTGDVTNPHLSLQQSLLEANRLNLTATKVALDTALETYKKASIIEFNVLFMTHGSNEVGERLQQTITSTRLTAEENAKIVMENYKENGWKKYLLQDIQNLVKESSASNALLQKITDFLKSSYSFRVWFVVNYRSNENVPYRFCLESRPFVHRYYHNDENSELLIAHAPLNRRFGSSSEANLRLSRLTPSDWHWRRCHKRAGDIYAELEYSCGSKRHSAVMVLPVTSNEFQFRTTNEGYLHQRTVVRHFPVTCHQRYNAVIFG